MCPKCNGSGVVDDAQCPVCRGHGHGECKGCDQCDPDGAACKLTEEKSDV